MRGTGRSARGWSSSAAGTCLSNTPAWSTNMAMRSRADLFDVSHMGEIEIAGRDALKAVQHITTNDLTALARPGQMRRPHHPRRHVRRRCADAKLGEEHYMFVVNASNIIKDFTWIVSQINGLGDVVAVNTSSRYALMAIRGPRPARSCRN